MKRKVDIQELASLIKEVVDSGSQIRIYPSGKSMLPTIVDGRDSVMLTAPTDLKKMDIVFYQRSNGQYVLHRIVAVKKNSFDMCGDNQTAVEKNVPGNTVIAKVSGIYKVDKYVSAESEEMKKLAKKIYRKKTLQRFENTLKRIVKKVLYPIYRIIKK